MGRSDNTKDTRVRDSAAVVGLGAASALGVHYGGKELLTRKRLERLEYKTGSNYLNKHLPNVSMDHPHIRVGELAHSEQLARELGNHNLKTAAGLKSAHAKTKVFGEQIKEKLRAAATHDHSVLD